jgi:hypothetical protein
MSPDRRVRARRAEDRGRVLARVLELVIVAGLAAGLALTVAAPAVMVVQGGFARLAGAIPAFP